MILLIFVPKRLRAPGLHAHPELLYDLPRTANVWRGSWKASVAIAW
jgi:hypothetical protein